MKHSAILNSMRDNTSLQHIYLRSCTPSTRKYWHLSSIEEFAYISSVSRETNTHQSL